MGRVKIILVCAVRGQVMEACVSRFSRRVEIRWPVDSPFFFGFIKCYFYFLSRLQCEETEQIFTLQNRARGLCHL